MVEPAQDLGEAFRHPLSNDFGIHPAELPANRRHAVGSERGRGFVFIVIAHRAAFAASACARWDASRRAADSRPTRCWVQYAKTTQSTGQTIKRQESNDQREKRRSTAIARAERCPHRSAAQHTVAALRCGQRSARAMAVLLLFSR